MTFPKNDLHYLFQIKNKEKDEEESLMGILAKVSTAYSKLKAENAELHKTVQVLEIENSALKEILSQSKDRRNRNDAENVDNGGKMKSSKNDFDNDEKGRNKNSKIELENENDDRGKIKTGKRDSAKIKDNGTR